MLYRLKATSPGIRVTDGPYAGRKYKAGEQYQDIPPQEAHRFEQVPESIEAASPLSETIKSESPDP